MQGSRRQVGGGRGEERAKGGDTGGEAVRKGREGGQDEEQGWYVGLVNWAGRADWLILA